MKKSILIIFVISSFFAKSQSKCLKHDSNTKLYSCPKEKYNSAVSEYLITNRDYITYILWQMLTVEIDYPGNVVACYPGYETINYQNHNTYQLVDEYYDKENKIFYMCSKLDWYVKDYMFNPKYIDYPVIGLTEKQALKFCKWLSDRYNEYSLIDNGFYKFSLDQFNENRFVTESFLDDQYYGARKNLESSITWKKNNLVNSFRLPTFMEIQMITLQANKNKLKKVNSSLKFLKKWHESFIEISQDGMILKLNYMFKKTDSIYLPKVKSDINLDSIKPVEMLLGDTSSKNFINAYENIGYFVKPNKSFLDSEGFSYSKDSVGSMNYIGIGRDRKGKMIQIEQDGFGRVQPSILKKGEIRVFRYSVTLNSIKK